MLQLSWSSVFLILNFFTFHLCIFSGRAVVNSDSGFASQLLLRQFNSLSWHKNKLGQKFSPRIE